MVRVWSRSVSRFLRGILFVSLLCLMISGLLMVGLVMRFCCLGLSCVFSICIRMLSVLCRWFRM